MVAESDAVIADGVLDSRCDISHLNQEERSERRALYDKHFLQGGKLKTAAGQVIDFDFKTNLSGMDWVVGDNVSVARTSCDLCKEINACRPLGSLPFVCLVKARPRFTREDGTSRCALCHVVRRARDSTCCRAIGGKVPHHQMLGPKTKDKDRGQENGQRLVRRKVGRPRKQVASPPADASSNDDDADEDSDGSLFGGDPSTDEEETRASDAFDDHQRRAQRSECRQNEDDQASNDCTTRSQSKRQRKSRIIPISTQAAGGKQLERFRSRSGRTIRPVPRYSNVGARVQKPSAASTVPAPSRIRQSQAASKSQLGVADRPVEKFKGPSKGAKSSTNEKARLMRQQCIKTANQLLALQTAEYEAEIAEAQDN